MADLSVMQDLIDGVSDAMDVFGKQVILRSFVLSGPSYNQTKTPVDTNIRAIQIDFEAKDRDGVVVTSRDTRYMIESKDINGNLIDPNMSMRLVDDKEYNIKNIEKTKPADTAIMYVLHVGI
jgi:hypothetical protein